MVLFHLLDKMWLGHRAWGAKVSISKVEIATFAAFPPTVQYTLNVVYQFKTEKKNKFILQGILITYYDISAVLGIFSKKKTNLVHSALSRRSQQFIAQTYIYTHCILHETLVWSEVYRWILVHVVCNSYPHIYPHSYNIY